MKRKVEASRIPFGRLVLFLISIPLCCALSQSACTAGIAQKPALIALSPATQTGSWQSDDLSVDYQFTLTDGRLEISGQVHFTNRIKDTFNSVDYFKLSAVLFDNRGKALESVELATGSNFSSRAGGFAFSKAVNLRQGAGSFAFAYSGQAHSSSTGDAKPFSRSFSYDPTRLSR